jgi:ribosomal protein L15
MPLQRRIPKRGFKNIHRVEYQVVNVRDLDRVEPGPVTPEILRDHGLVRTLRQPVKILGMGEVVGAYQVSAHAFSGTAKEKIEGAGGEVRVLGEAEVRGAGGRPEASTQATESAEASGPERAEASEAEEDNA